MSSNSSTTALPPPIKALIDNASGQSPPHHLPSLVSFLETEPSWSLQPQILAIFFRQFDLPLPNRITETNKYRIDAVMDGVKGIRIALKKILLQEATPAQTSLVLSTLLSSWPLIWKWLKFLYYMTDNGLATAFNAKSRPTALRLPIMLPIQRLLYHLLSNPKTPIFGAVLSTPGVLQMVIELWVRQADRPRDDEGLISDSIFLSSTLSKILRSSATDVRPITIGFGIGRKELALLLLKPFQRVVYGGEFWMKCYPAIIDVHLELFRRVPDVYAGLPSKDLVYDICYALTYFTSLPPPELSQAALASPQLLCIKRSYKFFVGLSAITAGYTWILQAFRFKIVSSLLRSAVWVPDSELEDALLVTKLFRIHVVHRPFLDPLTKALNSPGVVEIAEKIKPAGAFMMDWALFLANFSDALATAAAFDKTRMREQKCASPECKMVESTTRFRMCKACFGAVYCSKSCQKRDWKFRNHRRACDPGHRYQKTSREPLRTPRNIAYFRYILEQAIAKKDQASLRSSPDEFRSVLPTPQPFILFLDYSRQPPRFDVRLTCMVPELKPEFFSNLPKVHPFFLPCIALPYGKARLVIYIPTNVSGEMFGWFDRRNARPEKYGCGAGCKGHAALDASINEACVSCDLKVVTEPDNVNVECSRNGKPKRAGIKVW